jgi:DNA processing protein
MPGLKAAERIELEKKFDTEDDILRLSMKDVEKLIGRPLKVPLWAMEDIRKMAENDAARASKFGIHLVSWRESSYPPLLREIYDPPVLLFYRGDLPNPLKPLVAVVGTRKPSAGAAKEAFTLGRELGEAGIPVVSGLALGIDSMAHKGNIEGNAPTVAVLGSGPDMIFPASNRGLARRILEKGGAILSEYPPGTVPFKSHFPERNRIISALSRGVVVVEAPEKSGALITARFAIEQNRDLWVVKAGINSAKSLGTTRLAEDGAPVISHAAQILSEWKIPGPISACSGTFKQSGNGIKEEADLASSMACYLDIKL